MPAVSDPFYTFENGTNNWLNMKAIDFLDWMRLNGTTLANDNAPNVDHTLRTGKYLMCCYEISIFLSIYK